jgi:2-iminobutanoate/2-iminopropanoate deaminase
MKILLLLFPLLTLSIASLAQSDSKPVDFINPSNVAAPRGYSQAAVIDLGKVKMIIISGQVGLDKDGHLAGSGDFTAQATQAFENIKAIVESAGGTMKDVVRLGFYLTDISQLQAVRTVRDQYVNTSKPPASTLVQVTKLFRPDIVVEIEATAIISK